MNTKIIKLLVVILLSMFMTVSVSAKPYERDGKYLSGLESREYRVFEKINSWRAWNHLSPLTWNEDIAEAARLKSRRIAKCNDFRHGACGIDVFKETDDMGLSRVVIVENIAWISNRPTEMVFTMWRNSKTGHNEAMLNEECSQGAVGVYKDRNFKGWDTAYIFTYYCGVND